MPTSFSLSFTVCSIPSMPDSNSSVLAAQVWSSSRKARSRATTVTSAFSRSPLASSARALSAQSGLANSGSASNSRRFTTSKRKSIEGEV